MTGVLDGAVLLVALFRGRAGWRRGFVSQVLDLAGFAAAAVLAYRFNCTVALPYEALGMSGGWARVAGALTVFVPSIVVVAVVGWRLGRLTRQPGLNITNRVLGAGLGVLVAGVGLVVLRFVLGLTGSGTLTGVYGGSGAVAALTRAAEPVVWALGSAAEAVFGSVGACGPR